MEPSSERKSIPLLSLIASKAIVPGAFNDKKSDAEDEHHTHTMMYAARMKYLDDTDQIQPDTMFMTRKQAQKAAQRHDTGTISLKKLDVGPPLRKPNAANAASANASLTAWKKANKAATDEKNQILEAKFQAGCHFWQNVETSECRLAPPANALQIGGVQTKPSKGHSTDDEDVPFPDAFAFLKAG
ncbi:hypothetical protein FI667_g15849, partial [Globisporangium splendens]